MPKVVSFMFFTCLLIGGLGCCIASRYSRDPTNESSQLFTTQTPAARGVIILVHGLNQRPSSLNPLAQELQSLGYHCYRVTLRGHEQPEEPIFPHSDWSSDVIEAYKKTQQRHPNLPISLIGYSLGGLLITHVLDTHPEIRPEAVVLLAPALSLRLLPQTGYLLTLLPPLSWTMPNMAPPYYRRFRQTPLFWYRNTFTLYSETRKLRSYTRLQTIPTTILANPRDELVSLSGLQTWIDDNRLSAHWKIEPIKPEITDPSIPGHVIIDQRSLGYPEWKRMLSILRGTLGKAGNNTHHQENVLSAYSSATFPCFGDSLRVGLTIAANKSCSL